MYILNESKRDDMLLPYVNQLRERGINTNVSQLKQFLLAKFVNEGLIRNLSLSSNFYLVGVARYYFNGDLTSNKILNVFDSTQKDEFIQEVCERLNACILILRNAHIDSIGTKFDLPEDFGTLSLKALFRKYNKKINDILGKTSSTKKEKEPEVIDYNVGNDYTFDIIYSFGDAKKYNKFTEPGAWCITYHEGHYGSYIRNLGIHYVILRQKGFENVPRKKGENWTSKKPQDEYGNSLIALLQSNKNGEPVYITSRWNHGSYHDNSQCEADHAYTKEELFAITGMNDNDLQRIFNIWKTNRDKHKGNASEESSAKRKKSLEMLRYLKYGQMRMNGGEDIYSVFKNLRMICLYGNAKKFRKGTFGIIVGLPTDNDIQYGTVLCDRGQILFDTYEFLGNSSGWIYSMYKSSEENDNSSSDLNYKNIIEIKHNDRWTMLYDLKRRTFVDVSGVKKFKYTQWGGVRYSSIDSAVFYEVAMTNNQRALIDYNTNKPLCLPNGEYWFEHYATATSRNYHYGREIHLNEVCKNDRCILITYDSSARQNFYYDINTKRFFDVEHEVNESVSLYAGCEKYPDGIYLFEKLSTNNWHDGKTYIYKNGRPLEINGASEFKYVNIVENTPLCVVKDANDNIYKKNIETNEDIEIFDNSGLPIPIKAFEPIVGYYETPKEEYKNIVWGVLPDFNYDAVILCNFVEKKCYINPLTNSYIFYRYGSNFGYRGDRECKFYKYPKMRSVRVVNPVFVDFEMLSLNTIINYTEAHSSEVSKMPQSQLEDVLKWAKANPDKVASEFWEYIKETDNTSNYRIAEIKLNLTDIQYIITEAIKRLK